MGATRVTSLQAGLFDLCTTNAVVQLQLATAMPVCIAAFCSATVAAAAGGAVCGDV